MIDLISEITIISEIKGSDKKQTSAKILTLNDRPHDRLPDENWITEMSVVARKTDGDETERHDLG